MDATSTSGQPRVLISRDALLHNVRLLRKTLAPGVKICAIVKADAYGHSAPLIADALTNFCSHHLEAPAADALAVASLEEALAITPSTVPIYILRPVENVYLGRNREALEQGLRAGHTLTLISPSSASDVARLAQSLGRRVSVQVMVDTGVSREGCPIHHLPALLQAIDSYPSLRLAAIATHFAASEEAGNPFTPDQLRRFRSATESYCQSNPRILRHTANSGAIFFHPDSHMDMVRPGLSLYGIDPTGHPTVDRPLRPVLKWTAPLLLIRNIPQGTTVGYGQTWEAQRDTRIGLVPVGYADGYLRTFSNRAVMMVHGQPAPVIGRVSMDYTTIDLTRIPHANAGDTVTVMDDDPLSPASVHALSQIAQTIPYELFCHIGQRIPRCGINPADAEQNTAPTSDSQAA